MKVRMSSIPVMLGYLAGLGTAPADSESVREVLSHSDYKFEIQRYGLPSIEHLIFYFSRLKDIRMEEIPDLCQGRNDALRQKHGQWLDCLSHPGKYYERYEKMKRILSEENIQQLQHRLSSAFPGDVSLHDADVVSTLSFGPSFGYVYENALHLDLFGIGTICTMEELPYVILHEMHHLQVQKLIGSYASFTGNFSMLDEYIFRFTGEGLAVKFCNNAQGVVSKRINANLPANIGIPAMPILNRHFEEHLRLFNETIRKIRQNAITEKEIDAQFQSYWWNPGLYKDEINFLPQTPIYSFGNEIFGCIYDVFGMDVLFECFYSPARTIARFNQAGDGYTLG